MEANHIIFVEVVEGELFQALDMCRGEVQQRQHLNATLNQDKKRRCNEFSKKYQYNKNELSKKYQHSMNECRCTSSVRYISTLRTSLLTAGGEERKKE